MPAPADLAAPAAFHPLVPTPYRVVGRVRQADDIVTIALTAAGPGLPQAAPGQFNMVAAYGVGEVAVSVSGHRSEDSAVEHTVRDVGAVSHALCSLEPGDTVGVRGPFGTPWGADEALRDDGQVVVVAGGIGLAPLRMAIDRLCQSPAAARRVWVVAGGRSPDQVIFRDELQRWEAGGARVTVTVDVGDPSWDGPVGVVTAVLPGLGFEPARTSAFVCGPEIMMRFVARDLIDRGVAAQRVFVSLERNMQCGLGWCGHCQLGGFLVCRDGPVAPFGGRVERALAVRER